MPNFPISQNQPHPSAQQPPLKRSSRLFHTWLAIVRLDRRFCTKSELAPSVCCPAPRPSPLAHDLVLSFFRPQNNGSCQWPQRRCVMPRIGYAASAKPERPARRCFVRMPWLGMPFLPSAARLGGPGFPERAKHHQPPSPEKWVVIESTGPGFSLEECLARSHPVRPAKTLDAEALRVGPNLWHCFF